MKKKLLLHVCCAPDATVAIERLREVYDITIFFYNPNIHPQQEHNLRVEEMKSLAKKINVPLTIAKYDADRWFQLTEGLEMEPEGGKRCEICYRMRLEETAKLTAKDKFDIFTTVLTVSPHKNADIINQIGQEISMEHHVKFLVANLKKQDGFKRSIELSKQYNLYRQDYCGCIYSKR